MERGKDEIDAEAEKKYLEYAYEYLGKTIAINVIASELEQKYAYLNSPDKASRSEVEWWFRFCRATDPDQLAFALNRHLRCSTSEEVRLWAATLLRSVIIRRSGDISMEESLLGRKSICLEKHCGNFLQEAKDAVIGWLNPSSRPLLPSLHVPLVKGDVYLLTPDCQKEVQDTILDAFCKENRRKVIMELCSTICFIASHTLRFELWPEFWGFLFENFDSPRAIRREGSMIILSLLAENMDAAYMIPKLDFLYPVFARYLSTESHFNPQLATANAVVKFVRLSEMALDDGVTANFRHLGELMCQWLKAMVDSGDLVGQERLFFLYIELAEAEYDPNFSFFATSLNMVVKEMFRIIETQESTMPLALE